MRILKCITAFRSILYFTIVSVVSSFIVAIVYAVFLVVYSNMNNISFTQDMLTKELEIVLASPIFVGATSSILRIFYYFARRKKINMHNKIVPKVKVVSSKTVKIIVFSLALGYLWRIVSFLILVWLDSLRLVDLNSISTITVPTDTINVILYGIYVCILGPIAEELIFRKVFIFDLDRVYGYKISIIIAYLVFVFLHTGANMVYVLVAGALWIYLYLTYGNIFICMISHGVMNFIGIANIEVLGEISILTMCASLFVVVYCIDKEILSRKEFKN